MAISQFNGIGLADALYYGDKPAPKTLVGKELYKMITPAYKIHIMEHTKSTSQVWIAELWGDADQDVVWYTAGRFSFENQAVNKAVNPEVKEETVS